MPRRRRRLDRARPLHRTVKCGSCGAWLVFGPDGNAAHWPCPASRPRKWLYGRYVAWARRTGRILG